MPTRPPVHRPQGWRPPAPHQATAGGSKTRLGQYDRTWQKLRLVILARDPLCVLCLPRRLTASTQVDHIRPIAERPDLRLDPANLRGLCAPCHSRRTAAYERGDRR